MDTTLDEPGPRTLDEMVMEEKTKRPRIGTHEHGSLLQKSGFRIIFPGDLLHFSITCLDLLGQGNYFLQQRLQHLL